METVHSIALSGDTAIVGAGSNDDYRGSACIFGSGKLIDPYGTKSNQESEAESERAFLTHLN